MSLSPSPRIYTVDRCDFDIDGVRFDVSAVAFESVMNGVPTCTVGIAPKDAYVGPSGGGGVNVLSLKSLSGLYKALQAKAESLAVANLDVKLSANGVGAGKVDPRLKLSGWLLIAVGLTRVTVVREFSIMCTIAHPAYRLMLHNGFFHTGKGTVQLEEWSEEITDPVDAASKCIDAAIEANMLGGVVSVPFNESGIETSAELKTQDEVAEDLINAMTDTQKALKSLKWDRKKYAGASSDIPYDTIVALIDGGEEAIKYVLSTTWANAMTQTAWQALVGSVCPNFGLEVVPEYDQGQLIVGPCMPWTKNMVKLDDMYIDSVLMPGRDPDPTYGYVMYDGETLPADPTVTMKEGPQENSYIGLTNACFVPKESKHSVGTIRWCGAPSWLWAAIQKAASYGEKPTVTQGTDDYDDEMADQPSIPVGDSEDLEAWNAVVFSHMNDLFVSEYRKGVCAELSCPFVPNYGGKTLYPGMRLGVVTGGETLFTGRISTIRHTIDCRSSVATTNISLAYCLNGNSDSILGEEPKSPMYGSKGKLDKVD